MCSEHALNEWNKLRILHISHQDFSGATVQIQIFDVVRNNSVQNSGFTRAFHDVLHGGKPKHVRSGLKFKIEFYFGWVLVLSEIPPIGQVMRRIEKETHKHQKMRIRAEELALQRNTL